MRALPVLLLLAACAAPAPPSPPEAAPSATPLRLAGNVAIPPDRLAACLEDRGYARVARATDQRIVLSGGQGPRFEVTLIPAGAGSAFTIAEQPDSGPRAGAERVAAAISADIGACRP
jgi:hypothetical protein